MVSESAPEYLTTSDGPRYCSESCFTQSRRASFKKAKTCDWCKHVRHAVSYVDFQDGASQLQFCSDKCLNQYKMQIFCKETQAHLDMNPHLREQGLEAANNGANLITPDLWLRNCRSRSVSPASTISVSPGPAELSIMTPLLPPLSPNTRVTTSNHIMSGAISLTKTTTHKPMISVAPVSKLMSRGNNLSNTNNNNNSSRPILKNNRRKRPVRACTMVNISASNPNSTNHKHSPLGRDVLVGAQLNHNNNSNNNNNLTYNHANVKNSTTGSLSQFAGSSVQDLHMSIPPLSPMLEHQTNNNNINQNQNQRATSIPPVYFATPTHHSAQASPNVNHHQPPLSGYTTSGHAPFMPNSMPTTTPFPQFFGFPAGFQPPPPLRNPMASFPQPDMACISALMGAPPPVTVMVPYPIIIPLPIPIPVPLPITDFYKAYGLQENRTNSTTSEQVLVGNIKKESTQNSNTNDIEESSAQQMEDQIEVHELDVVEDEPLDYTKAKESAIEMNHEITLNEERNSLTPQVICTPEPIANSPLTNDNENELHCITESSDGINNKTNDIEHNNDKQQILPKMKITRLQTKRTLMQVKETTAENSRPLRKRKRIIDCDFQKVALKDAELKEIELNNDNAARQETNETSEHKSAREKSPTLATTENGII